MVISQGLLKLEQLSPTNEIITVIYCNLKCMEAIKVIVLSLQFGLLEKETWSKALEKYELL